MVEKIKYAIFDMDGTLIDSLGYWEYFWVEFGKKYFNDPNFEIDEDIDKSVRTITMKEASILLRDRYLPDKSGDDVLDLANSMIENHYKTRVDAKFGVLEFLKQMKARGVKMCVASATEPKYIRYVLERCGLDGFFEFIISCTEVGVGKEKPDVFLKALERLGGNLSEACVFEDSFVALETAKNAGFMTVGIYDKHNYGQDRLRAAADVYIAGGQSLLDMVD